MTTQLSVAPKKLPQSDYSKQSRHPKVNFVLDEKCQLPCFEVFDRMVIEIPKAELPDELAVLAESSSASLKNFQKQIKPKNCSVSSLTPEIPSSKLFGGSVLLRFSPHHFFNKYSVSVIRVKEIPNIFRLVICLVDKKSAHDEKTNLIKQFISRYLDNHRFHCDVHEYLECHNQTGRAIYLSVPKNKGQVYSAILRHDFLINEPD
jgi:hypothetical protein